MRSLLSRAASKIGGFFRSVKARVSGSRVASAFQRSRSGSSTSGS